MKNVLLKIEYDGSGFSGWQRQPGRRTVQGEIERVLSILCAQEIHIDGTGRTDAGVHALGQCASFSGEFGIPVDRIAAAANALLAENRMVGGDIRIISAEEMEPGFHARHSACGKTYIYRIRNSEIMPVFMRKYVYHVRKKLDTDAMISAAFHLEGTMDFSTFMTDAAEYTGSTVKTVHSARIAADGDDIVFRITGSGFLYNMVRIMTGTLVDIGIGRMSAGEMPEIVQAHDRRRAGHTAPPQGLYMEKVYFSEEELKKGAEACRASDIF